MEDIAFSKAELLYGCELMEKYTCVAENIPNIWGIVHFSAWLGHLVQ